MKVKTLIPLCTTLLLLSFSGLAEPIGLQQATATFSQTSFAATGSIDRMLDNSGWAIYPHMTNQTAVFETSSDVGFAQGTELVFRLIQTYPFDQSQSLGRFRLSVTTDPRETFADGLQTMGDVEAAWTVLKPAKMQSQQGTKLVRLPDDSILTSGLIPATDTYTITAVTTLTNITGVRIEALQDASLPDNGPGRCRGNFVLTELELEATPPMISTSIRMSEAEICWVSHSNRVYHVEYRSDLTTNTWMPLFTNVSGNGESVCVYDKVAQGEPQKFYRVFSLTETK